MYTYTTVLALSVFLSASGPQLAVPEKPFTAKVSEVYHGDALRLDTDDGRLLVSLYGVKGDALNLTGMKEAEEFITSMTTAVNVEIHPIKKISGLSYVEAILPSGEVLNKLLLEKGLVQLDTLSASNDEVYAEIASKAKESGPVEPEDLSPDATKSEEPQDPSQALASFKVRKQLKEIAQFEAEVEKWKALPEGFRRSLAESYGYTLKSGVARLSQEVANRQQRVEGTVQKLKQNQARIAAHQQAIASVSLSESAALAEVFDDFDLKWDREMADSFHKDMLAESATGAHYSARISAQLLSEYNYKVMLDQQRLGSEAAAVSAAHENVRAAHRGEIANIQSQHSTIIRMIRHAEADAQAAASMAAKHEKRYSDALQRIQMLDGALAEGFQPSLIPIVTEQFRGDQSERFANFPVESIIWRIDWYVKKLDNTASFSIDLYDAQNDKFLQHIITEQAPYESFLICENPGEYYVKINGEGDIQFIITIVQFRQS